MIAVTHEQHSSFIREKTNVGNTFHNSADILTFSIECVGEIPYTIRYSNIKYAYIRIKDDNNDNNNHYSHIEVILPKRARIVSDGRQSINAVALLEKKESWIKEKFKERSLAKQAIQNDSIILRGEKYSLHFITTDNIEENENDIDSKLCISLFDHQITISTATERQGWSKLKEWMKQESMKVIKEKSEIYAQKLGVSYNKLFLRNSKSGGHGQEGRILDLTGNWYHFLKILQNTSSFMK